MSPLPPGERAAPLRRQSSPPAPRGQTPPLPPRACWGAGGAPPPSAHPGDLPPEPAPGGTKGKSGRKVAALPLYFTIRQDNQHKHALGAFPPPVPPPGRVPGPRRGELGGSPALTHPQARRRPARQAAGGSRERGRLCPPHRPQAGPRGGRPRGGMGGG